MSVIHRRLYVRPLLLPVAAIFCVVLLGASAYAVTTISQGYTTSEDIAVGALVSLEKNSTDTVISGSAENANNLFGVVINDGSSLVSVENGSKKQVQVATSGVVPALVSDCGGDIAEGDPITASPIRGVGMVAITNTKIIGVAQGSMTGMTKQKVDSGICANGEVTVGQVPVLVNVAYHYRTPEKTIIPAGIQNVANTIAGKKVNSLPIVIGAGIFLITVIIVTVIIYSMIRSSIISVGRNPMAQSAVYRDVIQLSALVLGILSVGMVAIYLVLTRV